MFICDGVQGQNHGIWNGFPSNSYISSIEEEDICKGMAALDNVGWKENNIKDGGWGRMKLGTKIPW
jgi:hypothetical protein